MEDCTEMLLAVVGKISKKQKENEANEKAR